jgi:N-acetylmuramoyl-L-alanine amidase
MVAAQAMAAQVLFVVLALAFTSLQAGDLTLNAQIGGDSQRTRFVAFISKKADYRIFSMIDPYRIVIDLPEAEIQVPAGSRGLVLSSRSGLFSQGKSRIVIDLAQPALVEKSELLPPENGLPARLVVELVKSTHRAFLAASKIPPPAQPKAPVQNAGPEQHLADNRPLIVVDPGHGGVDAGASGRTTSTPEKEVTFDFCMTLKEKLEETGRYRVIMTRSLDIFVPLDERAAMASDSKAALLISIHADALDAKRLGVKSLKEVRGGTIYTLSEEASDEQANALAQNENKADVQAGVGSEQSAPDVSAEINTILNELEGRAKRNISMAFANYLTEHLKDNMKFNIRPHRSANLRVLKATGVPAVLIELGYLSNDDDEKLLTSKEWRALTAGHVADAVNAFMTERRDQLPL